MIEETLRALIVEDDRSWQHILSELLTDAGLAVDVVDSLDNATAALRAAPHRLAVIDLSLSEGNFDNQDGLRALQAIRCQDPGCVAVMLTGFATVELAVSAINDYGALTCLRKETFDRAEFRRLIRQALAQAPPEIQAEPMVGATQSPEKVESPSGQGVALVVEDDAGWRSILSELLLDAGYKVRLCNSYGEALGCLRRDRFALAVIDLSLAGFASSDPPWEASEEHLDGYRLLASTRETDVPTLVVSGVAGAEEIESAYAEQGIFAYIQKQTFDRRAFLQAVDGVRAARAAGSPFVLLTGREHEVLALLAQGMTNKEIARMLVITINTVKRHLKSIFEKLDVHTRSAAAAQAIKAGILIRIGHDQKINEEV
ncbi:MAG: response regulator [Anaerolineae bacterium]|nr:response regulator [Anaerolineae bacterium]